MKKIISIILLIVVMINFSSCGSLYDKEYVYIEDYLPPNTNEVINSDTVNVSSLTELRSAVKNFVNQGYNNGKVIFSENYKGDVETDLRAVTWQLKTQDALCAYCVENIDYFLNEIVSCYEADIIVTYSNSLIPVNEIIQLTYSAGLEEIILSAYEKGQKELAILIGTSSYTDQDLEELFYNTYFNDPMSCPVQPIATVNMYSGNNMQRLYEITIDYSMNENKLKNERYAISSINPFEMNVLDSDLEKYNQIAMYLSDNCRYNKYADDTIFSALVNKEASSKGISLAFKAFANELGLECIVVKGQKDRYDYYWNIIHINDDYYHLDLSSYFNSSIEKSIFNDVQMWGTYRWDTFDYPSCEGMGVID